MRGEGADEDIEVLIEMRREVGVLRRALAAHRFALFALMHPELEALGDKASAERFQSLFARFEATLQESRDVREAIVGSFDVLIARAGHQTNEIMKVLTLASVILLPGSLLAGVMGMNFKVGLFSNASLFWVVVAVIVAVAPLTIGAAKHWRWISSPPAGARTDRRACHLWRLLLSGPLRQTKGSSRRTRSKPAVSIAVGRRQIVGEGPGAGSGGARAGGGLGSGRVSGGCGSAGSIISRSR